MLRIGIIGSGFGVIGLKPAFESMKGCRVVGVCKRSSDWKTFLQRDDIDAVAIAVPPKVQHEIAKAAIKKGLHVFAEKPLAANLRQAKELYALSRKKKVITGIDFIFPEIAEWRKVKELLEKKTFGALQYVSVDWDWQSGDVAHKRRTWRTDIKEGGGALSFYFSHGLYYLEHFCGEITGAKTVFTHSAQSLNEGETGIDMLLKFKSGVTGNVHVSCNSPGYIRHTLTFICKRGVIVLGGKNTIVDDFSIKTYTTYGEHRVVAKKERGKRGEDERVRVVRKLAKKFVNACASKKQMTPSFAEGLRVQELIEKIRKNSIASR